MAHFQEPAIVEAHTLTANVPYKLLKGKISLSLIGGDTGDGKDPFGLCLSDPTGPVIGYRGLVLATRPASAVEWPDLAGILIQPGPGDILAIMKD